MKKMNWAIQSSRCRKSVGVLWIIAATWGMPLGKEAFACGCFAPPSPAEPIVQAGEKILFSQDNGKVTAHIQVQYEGPAEEFGWLVPVPSIPELKLGVDELFSSLVATTEPRYWAQTNYIGDCFAGNSAVGCGDDSSFDGSNGSSGSSGGAVDNETQPPSPLIAQESIGPYDYAVLSAASKEPMFDWLRDNGFFVPAGTEDVSDPYIGEDSYFLALKLRKGENAGNLQPVVLEYESDLPMIPIVLTSVAATPDMGIHVWIAGEHRAIPRNYFHVRINDSNLDWINNGANYNEVVNDAIDETEGHHAFITEYAGASIVMVDQVDPAFRFGNLEELASIDDPQNFIEYLQARGYFSSTQLLGILRRHLPIPFALSVFFENNGIPQGDYYAQFRYYTNEHSRTNPQYYEDLDLVFDPVDLTSELAERIVNPTREAGQTFRDFPYLTRLFTSLSPNEMTKDPVFSFNPDLPDVSNIHEGTLNVYCREGSGPNPAVLTTESGFVIHFPDGTREIISSNTRELSASSVIEILREEGNPEIVSDTREVTMEQADFDPYRNLMNDEHGGCQTSLPKGMSTVLVLLFGGLWARRKRKWA